VILDPAFAAMSGKGAASETVSGGGDDGIALRRIVL
jgi:hypothetical protein